MKTLLQHKAGLTVVAGELAVDALYDGKNAIDLAIASGNESVDFECFLVLIK